MKRSWPTPEHFSRRTRPTPVASDPSTMNSTENVFQPRQRPSEVGVREQTVHAGTGDQLNAPAGVVNQSRGHGNNLPGANFNGDVSFINIAEPEPRNLLEDCCKSLAFPEMNSRSKDIDKAAKGTCEWLRVHPAYTRWIRKGGLLWIKGNPGSGKSTLLQHALDHSVPTANAIEDPLILSFFFHGRGNELQKSPLGLFRSLLYQLRDVPDALSDLVQMFQRNIQTFGKPDEKWRWHPRDLLEFFKSSVVKVLRTRPLWLFVDALDECGKEEEARKLAKDLESLLENASPELKQVRICFTCRHYPNLTLDSVFEICVEQENSADIVRYVQNELSGFQHRISPEILGLITKGSNGVFLWARYVVDEVLRLVLDGAGPKKIEDVIHSVPQELDILYRNLIESMGPDSQKLIRWICYSTRPLSLIEMRWAMLVEADCQHNSLQECQDAGDYPFDDDGMKRRLKKLSCGLAEVTPGDNIIQFIHQSVKDYFISEGLLTLARTANLAEGQTLMNDLEGVVHDQLSRICLRYMYLNMDEIAPRTISSRNALNSDYPLLHYAVTSWGAHAKQSEQRGVSQDGILKYFYHPPMRLVNLWLRVFCKIRDTTDPHPQKGTRLIHILCRHGLIGPLRAILQNSSQTRTDFDKMDDYGRTPLSWAAGHGHEGIVKLLLDRGANINPRGEDTMTPLLWACGNGHESIAKLLIHKGADIGAINGDGWTSLIYAVYRGDEATVRLLVNKGANINTKTVESLTPLMLATASGNEAIVKLLVDKGACIDAKDKDGMTPLSFAAARGRKAVVKLLVNMGATARAEDRALVESCLLD